MDRRTTDIEKSELANKIRMRKLFYRSLLLFILAALLLVMNAYLPPGWNHGYFWLMLLWFLYIVYQGLRTFTHSGIFSDEWETRKIEQALSKTKKPRVTAPKKPKAKVKK